MNPMTAMPYWVDHINRVTSSVPPVHIHVPTHSGATNGIGAAGGSGATGGGSSTSAPGTRGGGNGGSTTSGGRDGSSTSSGAGHPSSYTLETLPEYRIYISKLTKLLDQLDRVNSGTPLLTNHTQNQTILL